MGRIHFAAAWHISCLDWASVSLCLILLGYISVICVILLLYCNLVAVRFGSIGNIIRTALCWIVWHNVHSQQHTYMSSSYRSNRLGLSHWDPYAVCRGSCLELYYCNTVEWFWWVSSLISTTNWFPLMLWHCWFGHLVCKNRPGNDLLCVEWDVKPLRYCYCCQL